MRVLTPEEVDMVNGLKSQISTMANTTFTKFKPVLGTSQVVAGTNYKVKIDVGNLKYVHAKIFKPLPYTGLGPELTSVETGKNLHDSL